MHCATRGYIRQNSAPASTSASQLVLRHTVTPPLFKNGVDTEPLSLSEFPFVDDEREAELRFWRSATAPAERHCHTLGHLPHLLPLILCSRSHLGFCEPGLIMCSNYAGPFFRYSLFAFYLTYFTFRYLFHIFRPRLPASNDRYYSGP
jgi:hypothetical protein